MGSFAILLMISCGNAANHSFSVDLNGIVGGKKVKKKNHPGFLNAVALRGGNVVCSGALISPDTVLTAAHCVVRFKMTTVFFGTDIATAEQRQIVSYRSLRDTVKDFPNYDLAVVKFEGALPAGYKPLNIVTDVSILKTATLVLVGFGLDNELAGKTGVMRSVNTTVQSYLNDDKYKSLFIVGPNRGRGACQGDSGGPAYVRVGDKWMIAGITNGLSRELTPEINCNSGHSIYTFAGDYVKWIFEAT